MANDTVAGSLDYKKKFIEKSAGVLVIFFDVTLQYRNGSRCVNVTLINYHSYELYIVNLVSLMNVIVIVLSYCVT